MTGAPWGWDPALYERAGPARLRPALDLVARIPLNAPQRIVDLGCGPGTVTGLLRRRWPSAAITGLDSDPAMLATATASGIEARWVEHGIEAWADGPWREEGKTQGREEGRGSGPDLVFSNAALHWLPDHAALFPRLLRRVAPGGALAVQMPANFRAPSHRVIAEVASSPPFAEHFPEGPGFGHVHGLGRYAEILHGAGADCDLWETTYLHILEGPDAVFAWVSGSALRPALARLPAPLRAGFEKAVKAGLRAAYPQRDDGCTLFAFTRIFMVARKL